MSSSGRSHVSSLFTTEDQKDAGLRLMPHVPVLFIKSSRRLLGHNMASVAGRVSTTFKCRYFIPFVENRHSKAEGKKKKKNTHDPFPFLPTGRMMLLPFGAPLTLRPRYPRARAADGAETREHSRSGVVVKHCAPLLGEVRAPVRPRGLGPWAGGQISHSQWTHLTPCVQIGVPRGQLET